MSSSEVKLRRIRQYIGMGRWQVAQYLLLLCIYIPWAYQMLGILLLGFLPRFACFPIIASNTSGNHVVSFYTNGTYHTMNRGLSFGQSCDWHNSTSNSTEQCSSGYLYDEPKESSILSYWDLVCGKAYMSDLSQTLFMVGFSIGSIIFGQLGDKFGRRPVLTLCHTVLLVFSALNALVPDITTFIAARCMIGVFVGGAGVVAWVAALELFLPRHRVVAALTGNMVWGVSVCTLPLLGFLMRGMNWRYVQLALSSISITSILQYFFVAESIQWLLSNGKEKDALTVAHRAAKYNNVVNHSKDSLLAHLSFDGDLDISTREQLALDPSGETKEFGQNEDNQPDVETANIPLISFVKHPQLRKMSAIVCLLWFTNSLTYIGLFMLSSTLAGNRYLNLFLSTVVEIPAYLCLYPITFRFSRRHLLILVHLVAGVSMIAAALLEMASADSALTQAKTGFMLLGKFSITATFGIVFMFTPEIFPTNIRSFGTALGNTAAKLGGFLSPFAFTLSRYVPWAPAAVFGVLCVLVGFLCLLLPETKGKDLPQTLEDVERMVNPRTAHVKNQLAAAI